MQHHPGATPKIPINFGTYDFQVGGHGQTDDTGLVTLFNGTVICKPINVDQRGYNESFFYRDLALSIIARGEDELNFTQKMPPVSPNPDPKPYSTGNSIYADGVRSQGNPKVEDGANDSNVKMTTTTTHFGWFGLEYIHEWHNYKHDHHQDHLLHLLNPLKYQMLLDRIQKQKGPSSENTPPSRLIPILNFLLTHQLPVNPLPPQQRLLLPTVRHNLFLAWYYRALFEKLNIFPIPIGSVIKHIISSNTLCYPVSPYEPKTTPNDTIEHFTKPYLALQSLTSFYQTPGVIDIKLGQMSWGLTAQYAKMDYELIKSPQQQECGFRLVGANIPVIDTLDAELALLKSAHSPAMPVPQPKLIKTIQLGRKMGQQLRTPTQLYSQLQTLFSTFILPPLVPITTQQSYDNDICDGDYNLLIKSRQTLQFMINLCMNQQMQEIILLQYLYPTHQAVASSVLISFESNPLVAQQLVDAWKQCRLKQYQEFCNLIENRPINLTTPSHDDWVYILTQTHQLYLKSLINQYFNNVQWFNTLVRRHNLVLDQTTLQPPITSTEPSHHPSPATSLLPSPSKLLSVSLDLNNQLPLPITLKLIDFAHLWDPPEFQKQLKAFRDAKCTPINNTAHNATVDFFAEVVTSKKQDRGSFENKQAPTSHSSDHVAKPMIQLPGVDLPMALATIYRHEYTATNQIWIDCKETLQHSGIVECHACKPPNPLIQQDPVISPLPMTLPRPYKQTSPNLPITNPTKSFQYTGYSAQTSTISCDPVVEEREGDRPQLIIPLNPNFPPKYQSRAILPLLYQDSLTISGAHTQLINNFTALDHIQHKPSEMGERWLKEVFSSHFFKPIDIGWAYPLLCQNHQHFTIDPHFIKSNPRAFSTVRVLPIEVCDELDARFSEIDSTFFTSAPSTTPPVMSVHDILSLFDRDNSTLNGLKSLFAYISSSQP